VPQPGDTAVIDSGTVTAQDRAINGVALVLDGASAQSEPNLILDNVTLDAGSSISETTPGFPFPSDFATITMHNTVVSAAPISLFGSRGDAHLTIDIGAHSTFINNASFSSTGFLDIEASGARSSFVNNGTISTVVDPMTVNAPTSGSGTFDIEGATSRASGDLTFGDSVGSGIKVAFTGPAAGPTLVLDKPLSFLGSIAYDPVDVFGGPGPTGQLVYLPNTAVTSETYASNHLTLFDGGTVVGRLSIAGNFTPANFSFQADSRGGTDLLFTAPSQLGQG
jgi:hypothetical protein